VNHPPDQDLLLLAHRSLAPFRAVAARWHIRNCVSCRKRFSEFDTLSSAVASAFRLGMPAWKPLGTALSLKLLIGIIVVALGLLGGEVVVSGMAPATSFGGGACATVQGSQQSANLPPANNLTLHKNLIPRSSVVTGSGINPKSAPQMLRAPGTVTIPFNSPTQQR